MKTDTVLLRLAEDDGAKIMQRVRALEQVLHPPLTLLRRLLILPKKPRKKPVPAKLKAVAALKYAEEMELRRIRKARKARPARPNALGIV